MGKISEILKRKKDDDQDDQQEAAAEAQPAATQAGAEPEGDASHPPAAMPADASTGAAPGDAPETFSSIEEYEQTLDVPDSGLAAPPGKQDA